MPTELDAVQTAMTMENKTYDFYVSRSKEAAYNAEKDFYEAVASQEKEHHRVLLDYYEFSESGGLVRPEGTPLPGRRLDFRKLVTGGEK